MRKRLALLFLAATVAFTLLVYDQLPTRIATHFGSSGPNAWSSRAFGAWLLPTLSVALWALLRVIPAIDPRHANYARFQDAYDTMILGLVVFLLAIQVAVLGYTLGWPVRVEVVVPVALGFLFILIGSILPRTHPTWFIGIRTPWTLSSDEVWRRTHRVAGYTMTAAGLLLMTLALTRSRTAIWAVIIGTGVLTLSPVVYSYFAWRSLPVSSRSPSGDA